MKLIVGLGNPGREYRETRHNVGFMVVDELARRDQLTWALAPSQVPDAMVVKRYVKRDVKRDGDARATSSAPAPESTVSANAAASAAASAAAAPLLLAKPLTFMNRSGDAVAALTRYYGIAAEDVLVVVDEVDLPFGRLRARARGSAGTHNGLKSIVARLGTTEFSRLRLGVGRGDSRSDLADHVLSTFESGERAELESFIARAADAAGLFAATDIGTVMNAYNKDVVASETD